jgi:hypothetical protein
VNVQVGRTAEERLEETTMTTASARLRTTAIHTTLLLVSLAFATTALAVPVSVTSSNLTHCDVLSVPAELHELGLGAGSGGPFPIQEEISASASPASSAICPSDQDPGVNIFMTNLSGADWTEVWYVADPETSISNYDGLVNDQQAFRIDSVGANRPLTFESIAFDDVFQAGETWFFSIDGYVNTNGLSAAAFDSCSPQAGPCTAGLVGLGSVGDLFSSGSIIAVGNPVPEPSTALLIGVGLLSLGLIRR